MTQLLRRIPSVERVLKALGPCPLPRPSIVAVVRKTLASLRTEQDVPGFDDIVGKIRDRLEALYRSRFQPVINGTGILLHTNLGRAPLGPEIVTAIGIAAAQYSNLEYDLATGERGSRANYLETHLALLCQAEAATVVNNCAAALVLVLRHLIKRRPEVIISRGELVQIGGGFRIPEIIEASGARLREIGTTNKTVLKDYADAIGPETALILKVHRSNFFMDGFVESPETAQIANLARQHRCPLIEDLGSGAVLATEQFKGLEHEPTPGERLKQGVSLVVCSGDKLFGGPQAGIIAGRAKLILALKREPFYRALRCDKLILAALEKTVDLYLDGSAVQTIPVLRMLSTTEEELRVRAARITEALNQSGLHAVVGSGRAQMGGGTLPRSGLRSITLELEPGDFSLAAFAARLRAAAPPVIGYIAGGKFKLDLRTIFPAQDQELIDTILTHRQSLS